MTRLVVVAVLLTLALAPPAQAKTKRVFWQQSALVPSRFFDQIGFIPINGIQPPGSRPQLVRAGSTRYRVTWINALVSRRTTTEALKEVHRDARYPPVTEGVFADRALRAAEKRRFQMLLDLARDADVLVVHRENPVCRSGLTLAQARGIARGTITRWSQVGTLAAGQSDAIVRRVLGFEGFAQPRLGAQQKLGKTIVKPDGGVAQILGGNRSVAAVTAWSRVRRDSRLCPVALGGVVPSDATVHGLEYPAAYPIQFVMHRKRRRDREGKALVRAYVAFLRSEKAAEMLRNTGVLLARDEPSTTTPQQGSVPGPSGDYQGRPIDSVQDDAAAREALTGQRLQLDEWRLAFDPGGALYELTLAPECTRAQGTWEVLIGWRYAEHGGGITTVVRLTSDAAREVTIQLPNDDAGGAYIDGTRYARDPGLSSSCP